jgi:hypothetical protein
MLLPRLAVCALLAATAVGAGGCAGATSSSAGGFTGAEKAVATTIDHLQDDVKAGDSDKVCSRDLAAPLVDRITRHASKSCASALDDPLKDVSDSTLKVSKGDITIDGDTATAHITSGSGSNKRKDTLTLVREGKSWKVSALGD